MYQKYIVIHFRYFAIRIEKEKNMHLRYLHEQQLKKWVKNYGALWIITLSTCTLMFSKEKVILSAKYF